MGDGSVVGGQSSEPAEDHGDVGSEDSPHRVDLVDHDVGEAMKEVRPAVVEGEDRDMEHVGIGEYHVGPPTDAGPLVGGSVTVVDRCGYLREVESVERTGLVLGEGLGRIDQQRGRLGILQ